MQKFRAVRSDGALPHTKRIRLATVLWLTADNCLQSCMVLFSYRGEEGGEFEILFEIMDLREGIQIL